jgi:apolipoprotein N-acyltransferase
LKKKFALASLISGLLFGIAFYCPSLSFINWLGWTPFCWAMLLAKPHHLWKYSLIFGISANCIIQYWVFGAAKNMIGQTGLITYFSYFTLIISSALTPLLFGIVVALFRKKYSTSNVFLLLPLVWVVSEWLQLQLFSGLPWTNVLAGYPLAAYIYSIQLAAVAGIWGISFCILLVSSVLAQYLIYRKKAHLIASIGILVAVHLIGFIMVKSVDFDRSSKEKFKVALLLESFEAGTSWNEKTGNKLASIFIDLNKQAAKSNPDLVLWSEGAIPWTFDKEDDLLLACLNQTKQTGAEHIIGILVKTKEGNKRYNSSVHLNSSGTVLGSYNKQRLLSLLEKPLTEAELPFLEILNEIGRSKRLEAGDESTVLKTQIGTAGVSICNEWLVPQAIRSSVNEGATFLLSLGNNGYFESDFSPRVHYWQTIIRAVENRRDVAINCNYGYSGIITASGRSEMVYRPKSTSKVVEVANNSQTSVYSALGDWLPITCIVVLVVCFFRRNIWS